MLIAQGIDYLPRRSRGIFIGMSGIGMTISLLPTLDILQFLTILKSDHTFFILQHI